MRDAIDGLYDRDPHPRGPLQQLADSTPFLLLPVRLETIFVPGQGQRGTELWVRVYPDEIAVNRFEDALSDAEVAAGELYWIARAWARFLRNERDGRLRDCWRHLVELLGPLATTAYQTIQAWRARHEPQAAPDQPPRHLDSCHALARDGEVVRLHDPRWYTGRAPAAGA